MHGARLADKARAKALEHAIRLRERMEETVRLRRVVRCVLRVLIERDALLHLAGPGMDPGLDAELVQAREQLLIERGHGHGLERYHPPAPFAGHDAQLVIDEIEGDLEREPAIGNGRRREPA